MKNKKDDISDEIDIRNARKMSTEDEAAEKIFGNYRLNAQFPESGMGQVYEAYDCNVGRYVALKRLKSDANEKRILRFQREAKTTARLQHPNIITIYEVGQYNGEPFFTMELIEGECLSAYVKKLSFEEIVRIMIKVSKAVDYAHREGVIHRDLKPSNIMIRKDGEVIVLDFGLAKILKKDTDNTEEVILTEEGACMGTRYYMSPEQLTGDLNIDERSDVYSLGAILYYLLTGERPFEREGKNSLAYGKPKFPRAYNKNIPAELEQICLKALEKQKTKRYSGAHELAADLLLFEKENNLKKTFVKKSRKLEMMSLLLALVVISFFYLFNQEVKKLLLSYSKTTMVVDSNVKREKLPDKIHKIEKEHEALQNKIQQLRIDHTDSDKKLAKEMQKIFQEQYISIKTTLKTKSKKLEERLEILEKFKPTPVYISRKATLNLEDALNKASKITRKITMDASNKLEEKTYHSLIMAISYAKQKNYTTVEYDEYYQKIIWQRSGRYFKSSIGTIVDTKTGLEWFVKNIKSIEFPSETHASAEKWIKELNKKSFAKGGWKLPAMRELRSIHQHTLTKKIHIHDFFMGDRDALWVWSSEFDKQDSSYAWIYHFHRDQNPANKIQRTYNGNFGDVFAVRPYQQNKTKPDYQSQEKLSLLEKENRNLRENIEINSSAITNIKTDLAKTTSKLNKEVSKYQSQINELKKSAKTPFVVIKGDKDWLPKDYEAKGYSGYVTGFVQESKKFPEENGTIFMFIRPSFYYRYSFQIFSGTDSLFFRRAKHEDNWGPWQSFLFLDPKKEKVVSRDFLVYNTLQAKKTIHIKTNMTKGSNIMYRFEIKGYNYNKKAIINSDIAGYTLGGTRKKPQSEDKHDYAQGIKIDQYYSKDGYLVIKLTVDNTYHIGFALSGWFVSHMGYGFDISAKVILQDENL